MKINSTANHYTSSPSFKNLLNRVNPADLKTDALKKEYAKILKIISKNNLDKKRFADISLNYDPKDPIFGGFFSVISDKKGNIPRNCYQMAVSSKKDTVNKLISWVQDWNKAFNPKLKESYWKTQRYVDLVIIKKKSISEALATIEKEAKSKPWLNSSKTKFFL